MKALALVEARNHVCCRYRVRAFEPALSAAGWSLTIEPVARGGVGRLLQLVRASSYDSILIQRKLLPGWQLRELRRRTAHLVFDFDDAILYRDSYDPRGPHCRRRYERFERTIRLSDMVIAGNHFLADCAIKAGAHPSRVQVIPTCVNTNKYAPHVVTERRERPGLELVWIGSTSTLAGLEQQRTLWERLGREIPGARLRLVCDRFLRFDPLPVLEVIWNERTEAADIAGADVGMSWVPDDLWSRGKCGLKVLQYQAAGLPVLANPVGVHPEMIDSGINGILVSNPEEWLEAARLLASDPELRQKMGEAARESATSGYSVDAWSKSFVAAVTGVEATAPKRSQWWPGKSEQPAPLAIGRANGRWESDASAPTFPCGRGTTDEAAT